VVTFLLVVVAVASTAVVYSFQMADLKNQLVDSRAAKLININLGFTDNGQGTLNVNGYIYNSGSQTAEMSYVQIDFYTDDTLTNKTVINIGAIDGGRSYFVNQNITYTNAPPTRATFTLGWIEPWEIAVP
jgi:hypothetical protein